MFRVVMRFEGLLAFLWEDTGGGDMFETERSSALSAIQRSVTRRRLQAHHEYAHGD